MLKKISINDQKETLKKTENNKLDNTNNLVERKNSDNKAVLKEIEIILPKSYNTKTSQVLINSFELSIYKSEIDNIDLSINRYFDANDLDNIMATKAKPGKIFVGTFNEEETNIVKKYCDKGIIFFSFSSKIELANECAYLVNFFPSDDLKALFSFFPPDSKIALLYPENFYGFTVNKIINNIAEKSNSLIVNRASYREDLSNARESIKMLGKYEIRKAELERQKKFLMNKNDDNSILALKKIQKFETLGGVDFTHILLPDYGIRLLEIAPLLPFYDVDPNKVQFVGTGTWDDAAFFGEPSLQGAIFSGIEESKRSKFFENYIYVYKKKPMRTATIPYDLVGLFSYLISKNYNLKKTLEFLDDSKIKFDGIDGKFYFEKNVIVRELNILKINDGKAISLNWDQKFF